MNPVNPSSSAARAAGSTLIVTLATLIALSLMAAYAVTRVMPRLRMAYQNAAWQEARLAAESGVDAAMGDLLVNATGPSMGGWPGWKEEAPGGGTRPVSTGSGSAGGLVGGLLTGTVGLVTGLLGGLLGGGGGGPAPPPPGNTVVMSAPIFLDNLRVSAASGVPTEVDVQLWALQPTATPQIRWFRIRSMATCALPPAAYGNPANLDAGLRRFSLRSMRPSLKRNDVGDPITIPTPNVSRTVEVLVEPVLPFELAIWTGDSLRLGPTGSWGVDSFDSRDAAKSSADGTYPGSASPHVQENGSIASNATRPVSSLYGPLIDANGARVRGIVATNGGDDPETDAHENVAGGRAVDPEKIRSDFSREMRPVARPTGGSLPPPPPGTPFQAGSFAAPTQYLVNGDLGDFEIAAPPAGAKGAIIIMIDGDLTLSGTLDIPRTVTAMVYVRGNIDIRGDMNSGVRSSNRAAQLQIYGEPTPGGPQTLRASGDPQIYATFYGPTFDVSLNGNVNWCGSIAGRSFGCVGGGAGGVHYDEALATVGPPVSFRIARYVEDVRE